MDTESLKSAGWTAFQGRNFTGLAGPYWARGKGAEREIGLLVEERHCNDHMGILHGGALMTFADIALGWGASEALGGTGCVTAQLQIYFVAGAKVGEFVSCKSELVRRTSHLVFVRGLIKVGDKTVASADGIWKQLEARAEQAAQT
jgi:acyl-coenzyme A thioesterase PaaI-like protein